MIAEVRKCLNVLTYAELCLDINVSRPIHRLKTTDTAVDKRSTESTDCREKNFDDGSSISSYYTSGSFQSPVKGLCTADSLTNKSLEIKDKKEN